MTDWPPITVVETPEFIATARRLLADEARNNLIEFLAYHPTAGDLIPGTGGLRKLRWALAGRGKSGGARVIYYFHDPTVPLFGLAVYAKGQRSDLSKADRAVFKNLIHHLVGNYRSK